MVTHKERVKCALAHTNPDRIPRDFAAEPAVWSELMRYWRFSTKDQVLRHLDIDIRTVSYDQAFFIRKAGSNQSKEEKFHPWKYVNADGTWCDIWGARRKTVTNAFASYEELCEFPLAHAKSIKDVDEYDWPHPHDWDFEQLNSVIDSINPDDEYYLRFRLGSVFETAWSLCGFDTFLENLLLCPELSAAIMDRVIEIHISNLTRVMAIAGDRIDMIYCYDDVAHQGGLLFSRDLWAKTVGRYHRQLFQLARSFGKQVMYHCCGDVCPLIPDLIKIGVTVLNPIQPSAISDDFTTLKQKYGSALAFHGGIDIQNLLPHASPAEVKAAVDQAQKTLGKDGGYILAPAHHIQADTPVSNILAMYECD